MTLPGRRFGMRIRQPCVKQKHRQLDCEGYEEAEHDPQFRLRRHWCSQQVGVLKCVSSCHCVMDEVERNNRNQHEEAAELGEYEKLHGCVSPMFMAPDGNQEVHRDEHQFPGKVEEEEIHGQEHPRNSCEDPQQIQMEETHRMRDLRPGGEYGHNAERKSQHQQQ